MPRKKLTWDQTLIKDWRYTFLIGRGFGENDWMGPIKLKCIAKASNYEQARQIWQNLVRSQSADVDTGLADWCLICQTLSKNIIERKPVRAVLLKKKKNVRFTYYNGRIAEVKEYTRRRSKKNDKERNETKNN